MELVTITSITADTPPIEAITLVLPSLRGVKIPLLFILPTSDVETDHLTAI